MRVVLTRREALDSRDGVNIFIVSLAQALCDLDHQVRIVVGSFRDQSEYRRLLDPRLDLLIFALSPTPLRGPAAVAAWLRAKWAIDAFQPDLVIHNEAVPLPLRGTIVEVVHDLQPRQGRLAPLWRSIRRFSHKCSDHVVATTTELRDQLVRELGIRQHRIAVIPKCLDLQTYRNTSLALRERAILHAGTLSHKDPGATIRAFGALDDPSVALYVTGEITGPTQAAVDALPGRLRARVSLLGDADGEVIRGLHSRVRVAAFPTLYAVPVASATVMEAVASRTPIVASSTLSGDVLADGVNGIVADTEPAAMAAALKALLNDNALWSRLSQGAARMVGRFDASAVARQYIELVRAVKGATESRSREDLGSIEREGADLGSHLAN